MSALIEVIDGGIANSIQDEGRTGFRHMGITVSGYIDAYLARSANALVGNSPLDNCAAIEIRAAGPTLCVRDGITRVALTGEISALIKRKQGSTETLPAWQSVSLFVGDTLEIDYLPGGAAYLAVSGGINSPRQLGSRSTYQRAMIGGIDGRPIMTGNLLHCIKPKRLDYRQYRAARWAYGDEPIRVILGPQETHFQSAALETFLSTEYLVTPQIDRMGVRLEGEAVQHISPAAADIVSDGVTPGTIQVPGNGQPIILLADCQTIGGYPKIATVISADVPRIGQWQAGKKIRFCRINGQEAQQALRERQTQWQNWHKTITFELPGNNDFCNDSDSVWDAKQ